VTLEATAPAPEGDRHPSENTVAAKQPDKPSLSEPRAYCVVMRTPYDRELQRVFLSLHSAVQAVERARKRGLQAELILCRLVPLGTADLDGGELS
jgi:hypothetical protein